MEDEYGDNRMQVRCIYDTNALHIQGVGPSVNRKYGIALELRAPKELTAWLSEQTPSEQSPASKETLYAPFELWQYPGDEENQFQFLIRGSELNHPKGAMLNMKNQSDVVKTLVEWAQNADLVAYTHSDDVMAYKGGEEE